MSYRPRSPSPSYRDRRYSPSRPRSRSPPPPPRRYDDGAPPRRYDDYPPPSRRYDDDRIPPPRSWEDDGRAHSMRRYEEPLPPPSRRYDDYPPYRSPPPPPRIPREEWERTRPVERYEERPPAGGGGMMVADREEQRREVMPPRGPRMQGAQWERGRDVNELDAQGYPSSYQDTRPKGPKGMSEPSRDVIFLGLDAELTENDFTGYLRTEHGAMIDSVKIVRDKFTGVSKCFGFAQFASLEGAEEFVTNNFPAVLMPALYAHSEPKKVKIDFSTPLGEPADPTVSRAGRSDFHAGHHHPQAGRAPHDGMRDIGSPGGGKRVLLLRGLDAGTSANEVIRRLCQEITRMIGKQGREKEAEMGLVRVVMVVDRERKRSWGICFVEFATTELASALLPFLLSPADQPNGFLISHVPVAASFANPEAFIPTPAGPLGSEFLLRPSRSGGIGSETIDQPDGNWVSYWHQLGGAVQTLPRGAPRIADDGTLDKLPVELRIFLGGLAGPVSRPPSLAQPSSHEAQPPALPSAGMVNLGAMAIQPIKIGGSMPGKKRKQEEEGFVAIQPKNLLADDEEEDVGDTVLLSKTKGVHSIIPSISSRKIAKNITKWNNKKTELAAPLPTDINPLPKGMSGANAAPQLSVTSAAAAAARAQPAASSSKSPMTHTPTTPTPTPGPEDAFDYSDTSTLASTGKVACLLCQRQFKTEEVLKRHVAQSDLHKTNLADATTCEAGRKRKFAATASATDADAEPKYRDRAAERRQAFNQPDKPAREELEPPAKKKFAEGPKPPPPPPEPGKEPGRDEANVGNQLLAKMGWKAGTGLGAEGEGRVDPVQVKMMAERQGLGAGKRGV